VKEFLGMSEDGFPQFILTNKHEDIMIEVSRDEEGNGGGFLFITDVDVV